MQLLLNTECETVLAAGLHPFLFMGLAGHGSSMCLKSTACGPEHRAIGVIQLLECWPLTLFPVSYSVQDVQTRQQMQHRSLCLR